MAHTKKPLKKRKVLNSYRSVSFLNLIEKGSPAMVTTKLFGDLTDNSDYNDNYEITFSSCHDKVLLHGKLKDTIQRKNALFKINTIIDEMQKLKEQIEIQLKENNLRIAK